jgi:hypothetical protein
MLSHDFKYTEVGFVLNRIRQATLFLLLLFFFTSCVDEYWPELDKYQNLLVLDGTLTDSNGPLLVNLSVSSPVNGEKYIPLSGGELFVTDENQVKTLLYETLPGSYTAEDTSFRGKVGSSYQLHIKLPNGKSYISDVCLLRESAPIDSIYGLIEEPDNPENNNGYPGMQFYVENHSLSSDTSYYLWKCIETYEYKSTFDIDYTWEGEFIPYPDPDSLSTCWRTARVNEILFASTYYLDPTAVNAFPIHFVSTATKRLSIRYSVSVEQLSISESAFNFYNAIKQQNIDQENLWTQQPYQILGNMHCVTNPDEPVLGFFVVAGASEKRIFLNRPALEFYYDICTPDFDLRFIAFEAESTWPIYIDDIMFLGWAKSDQRVCFDCRLEGGEITPPVFWEQQR